MTSTIDSIICVEGLYSPHLRISTTFFKKYMIVYGADCYHFDMKITNFASMTSTVGFYDF